MANEHEIGRVVAVDTAQVTVELNRDLKALTRSTYEGTIEVGRINSYIIIPVGSRRIVGMVTRVVMTEESELQADKTMVSLPSTRRLMRATMIGSIDEDQFLQGISLFPVLDSKVFLTTKEDLNAIFGRGERGERSIQKILATASLLANRWSFPITISISTRTHSSASTSLSLAAPAQASHARSRPSFNPSFYAKRLSGPEL